MGKIDTLEKNEMLGQLEEKIEKLMAVQDYHKVLRMEEISWRQKSKQSWLKEGDRNMKFFHKIVSWRQSINSLSRLKVVGNWVYD